MNESINLKINRSEGCLFDVWIVFEILRAPLIGWDLDDSFDSNGRAMHMTTIHQLCQVDLARIS